VRTTRTHADIVDQAYGRHDGPVYIAGRQPYPVVDDQPDAS